MKVPFCSKHTHAAPGLDCDECFLWDNRELVENAARLGWTSISVVWNNNFDNCRDYHFELWGYEPGEERYKSALTNELIDLELAKEKVQHATTLLQETLNYIQEATPQLWHEEPTRLRERIEEFLSNQKI